MQGSEAVAGIDEAGLTRLVHLFYTRVRQDAALAPVFDAAIPEADWYDYEAMALDEPDEATLEEWACRAARRKAIHDAERTRIMGHRAYSVAEGGAR